jgi:solute carrier family 25 phosphate transporter 3
MSDKSLFPVFHVENAGEKWNSRTAGHVVHDTTYYLKCMVGGMLACGLTHTAVCPLDVVKCNMQVDPKKFKGLVPGLSVVMKEQGVAGLLKGWLPTAYGYSAQGLFKFGLNEVFKDEYANLVGKENAQKYRVLVWAAASGSAEFFADIALCPFEMVKVKVQTSPAGTFPTKFSEALAKMQGDKAKYRFPFGSVKPLWGRQIPYTIAKFVGFEAVVEAFYTYVFTNEKSTYAKSTQLGITFASGYIAGVACAIVSQPMDNLVSQMGKDANKGRGFSEIAKEIGIAKLFTAGLGTRIIMIGTLTGLQWWIYDSWKTALGLGTSGGTGVKKH